MLDYLLKIIIFLGGILLYLHIYIHFKINKLNEFTTIDHANISKEKILTSIYYKLPFVFDGTNIIKNLHATNLETKKDKKTYIKSYESLPLLEPSVRFFTKDTIYKLKKGKEIKMHTNLECRNFYMIHSGKVDIYCIHPTMKDIDTKSIDTKNDILRVELYPNSILFVPNYWNVYVKASEKSVVEKVQYKTILNEINFLYDTCLNYKQNLNVSSNI
jgi:hypothetical protein